MGKVISLWTSAEAIQAAKKERAIWICWSDFDHWVEWNVLDFSKRVAWLQDYQSLSMISLESYFWEWYFTDDYAGRCKIFEQKLAVKSYIFATMAMLAICVSSPHLIQVRGFMNDRALSSLPWSKVHELIALSKKRMN